MGYERQMSARQKALDLAKKKDAIEAEMNAIFESLTKDGGPGMSGNLVDSQGFPRADIDVHGVRIQRNRFATLRTDHKMVTAEMEKLLHIALAPPQNPEGPPQGGPSTSIAQPSTTPTPNTETPSSQQETRPSAPSTPSAPEAVINGVPPQRRRVPFALVDIVSPGSPASRADLRVQDKIIAFGSVSLFAFATPSMALGALPGLLREHENHTLEVIVERNDGSPQQNLVTLNLTPQRWSGQGLLGCHVLPLRVSEQDEIYQPDVATAAERHSATFRPQ